jgi:hypothetical protein
MTNLEMEVLIDETFKKILELRRRKGAEYSEEDDALSNFRRDAAEHDMPMELIWRIFTGKHWDAISQYVKDIVNGTKRKLSEPIESRIDDMIVYLILLKAMIKERKEKEMLGEDQ